MLTQCTQCHKEYLPEEGLHGPSGKPYCSQFCLKQYQTPDSAPLTNALPPKQAYPLGQVILVLIAVCGVLYFLQNSLSGPDTESIAVVQSTQSEQQETQALTSGQDPLASPADSSAVPTPEVGSAAIESGQALSQASGSPGAIAPAPDGLSRQSASPEQVLQNAEKNIKIDPIAARASLEELVQKTPSAKAFHLLAQLQMQANDFSPARRSAEQCLNQARSAEDRKSCHELSIQVFQRQVETGIDEESSAKQRSETAAQLASAAQNPRAKTSASAMPSLSPQLTDRVKLELQQEELRHAQELITLMPKEGKGYWYRATAQCQLADTPDATAQANASLAEACHLGYAEACKQRCRNGKMGRS